MSNDLMARALAKMKAAQSQTEQPSAAEHAAEQVPSAPPEPENIPLNDLLQYISSLRADLQTENPQIEMYMSIIHKKMVEYPELVHLLDDEQISVVYKAALKQSNTTLLKVKEKTKKKVDAVNLELGQDW